MQRTEKPKRMGDELCPLFRKRVADMCHRCAWYKSMTVAKPETPQDTFEHWDCAITLNLIVSRDAAAAVNGLQGATEGFRNELAGNMSRHEKTTNEAVRNMAKLAGAFINMTQNSSIPQLENGGQPLMIEDDGNT